MRYFFYSLLFIVLFSCDKKKDKKEIIELQQPKREIVKKETNPKEVDYKKLDTLFQNEIKILDTIYPSTPFYGFVEDKKFFITCSDKNKGYVEDRFDGKLKYGIVNDSLQEVLPQKFDKVYNPNLVLLNCFEVKKGHKVGLFNYETKETLSPQFDFILPSPNEPTNIAYGYKDNSWFQIINSDFSIKKIDFNPIPILKSLKFDINSVDNNMLFDCYENHAYEGNGFVVVPSYIEYLNLMDETYEYVITKNQKDVDFGQENADFQIIDEKPISNKLTSFLASIYEKGIDARGYSLNSKELILYNSEKKIINSIHLSSKGNNDYYCTESDYKFNNDSIFEVKSKISLHDYKDANYIYETRFQYYKIIPNGKILKLESNRHFDFTKFIYIDEEYFKGCFVKEMDEDKFEDYNLWIYEHLTINDLDIMRNEIYAEYGYDFKSEKWKNYFNNKNWYKPLYNNVDDKLTEMDKENIKVILEVKEKMKGKESEFIKKVPEYYQAAG